MSSQDPSRRALLRGLFAAGCVSCLPRLSLAEAGKLSQAQAQYQDRPNAEQNCANCMQFVAPNTCKVVEGAISPGGWCKLWVKKQG